MAGCGNNRDVYDFMLFFSTILYENLIQEFVKEKHKIIDVPNITQTNTKKMGYDLPKNYVQLLRNAQKNKFRI